ncbi:hypothetical protein [Zavarzinia sp. CC-PAN008]|uniref:hypothetical protein n=1 Tax=Zavarzinia sp. CC-PAN008 TaxID=3243332 RepID=UPI003F745DC6
MTDISRRHLLILGLGGLSLGGIGLAGCQQPIRTPIYPELHFTHQSPIRLRLSRITVSDSYVSPQKLPNVEHTFPAVPGPTLATWARERLSAVGGAEEGRFIIENASVVEMRLPRRGGLEGLVTVDAGWQWEANLAARLEVGFNGRVVRANARRTVSIPENIRADDRDDTAFQMVRDVIAAFDGAMQSAINQNLSSYLG